MPGTPTQPPETEPGEQRARDLRRVARQGSLQLFGAVASAVFGFALVIAATRGLGKAEAGAFLVSIGLFQIVSNLAQAGADTGLVRSIPRMRNLGRARDVRATIGLALTPVALVGTVLGVAMLVTAPTLADLLGHGDDAALLEPYLRSLALFIPLAAVTTVALAGTRGFGTQVPSVLVESVAKPAVRPLLLLFAIATGAGAVGISLSYSLPVLLGAVVAVGWLLRIEERRAAAPPGEPVHATPRAELAREFWRYSIPRGVQEFLTTVSLWADALLLAALRSTGEAAVYTAASRLMLVGVAGLRAIIAVVSPQIAGFLARGERDRVLDVYRASTWWLMAFTWPFYLAVAIFAPAILGLFGEGFAEGANALVILSLAGLFNIAVGAVGSVLLMGGYSGLGLAIGAVSLAVNLVLNLVLIPTLGMSGAAIAWAVSILITNGAALWLVKRRMGLSPFGRGFTIVAVAALATYGLLGLLARWALGTTLVSFAVYALVAAVPYAAVLYRSRRSLHLGELRRAFRSRRTR